MFVVDSREPVEVRNCVEALGVQHVVEALPAGDFAWKEEGYICGCERKTVEDLVTSIKSGRIMKQMNKLKRSYPVAFLLIEGRLEDAIDMFRGLGFAFNEGPLVGFLASVPVRVGVSIITVPKVYQSWTLSTVEIAYKICEKVAEGKLGMDYPEKAVTPEDVLTTLPGVGLKQARVILKKYKTLRNFFSTTREELDEVKGLSRKDLIWRLINEPVEGRR